MANVDLSSGVHFASFVKNSNTAKKNIEDFLIHALYVPEVKNEITKLLVQLALIKLNKKIQPEQNNIPPVCNTMIMWFTTP